MTVPVKVLRYAQRVVDRYDRNGDLRLDPAEAAAMQGEPSAIDRDGDGKISVEEMAEHVATYGHGRRIRLMSPAAEYLIQFPSPLNPEGSPDAASESLLTAEPGASDESTGEAEPLQSGRGGGQPASDRAAKRFSVSRARIPAGLPDWFLQRDQDGDCQLTLDEFAPQARAADREEFAGYDANRDGLVTAWEYLGIPVRPRTPSSPSDDSAD